MKFARLLFGALLATSTLPACADLDDETLGETTSNLSAASWTPTSWIQEGLGHPPAMAMLNGVEYYVYTWDDDSPFPGISEELYWSKCSATACTNPQRIPGQQTMDRVSLAAFNGFIYMVHVGESDSSAVWFSRLDPATGQWTTNSLLSVTTFAGAPALAAFNNKLYMVGNSERTIVRREVEITTYPMWYVTMGANETFSPQYSVGSDSASEPSLASYAGKLYLAHRNSATGDIAINTLVPGGSWSAPSFIPAGPGNTRIQGDDVQIAETNGFLHLVHRRFTSNYTYWTYFDQCTWAPELAFDSLSTSVPLSMASGNGGLVLARLVDVGLWPYTINYWYQSRFIAPPAPITAPLCLPNQG